MNSFTFDTFAYNTFALLLLLVTFYIYNAEFKHFVVVYTALHPCSHIWDQPFTTVSLSNQKQFFGLLLHRVPIN